MSANFIFSWAENEQGKLVYVDDVPQGLACKCKCPYCHERLLARHGLKNQHGFAHHSETRGANLEICYMVTLYKLAENIIQRDKRIHAPSYYGIFPEKDICFDDVRIDSCFEREDKQPDVVATTREGQQYLIEFLFKYKVQHKKAIDYSNMNCLEIDLSNQQLETLEEFLLSSSADRKWVNNTAYFSQIESKYHKANKPVKVVDENECKQCEFRRHYQCAGVLHKNSTERNQYLVIEENGHTYRLCKSELYDQTMHKLQQEKEKYNAERQKNRQRYLQRKEQMKAERERMAQEKKECRSDQETQRITDEQEVSVNSIICSCFQCESNLKWANRDGFASCGAWEALNVPKKTPPDCAQTCKRFRKITP